MKNIIYACGIVLILTACSTEVEAQLPVDENATPTALLEDSSPIEGRSNFMSKRNWKYEDGDIINKLFDEACEKDKALKALTVEIKFINNDTLKEYLKYSSTNLEYWKTSQDYIARINDSLLKATTGAAFEKMACDYEYRVLEYSNLEQTIYQRASNLEDQLILMQLMVTKPMMSNYEVNEKPPIKVLEDLIKNYDDLIEQTEVYVD
jgi:hypothetical protein